MPAVVLLMGLVVATLPGLGTSSGAAADASDLTWVSISPLPAARLQTSTTIPLVVAGGTEPYQIAVVGGALPPGLAIDGMSLSGTPTATGVSEFTLRATDSLGSTADRTYVLSVVRGVRTISLEPVQNQHVVLGTLASRTQAGRTGTSSTTLPNPLTPGWVSISGSSAPYTMSGVDSRSGEPYTFQTDYPYVSTREQWRKEGDERSLSGTWTFNSTLTTHSGRSSALQLNSSGSCINTNSTFNSYCSVFGPQVWRAPFVAEAG